VVRLFKKSYDFFAYQLFPSLYQLFPSLYQQFSSLGTGGKSMEQCLAEQPVEEVLEFHKKIRC
jgi:hypothetical protein